MHKIRHERMVRPAANTADGMPAATRMRAAARGPQRRKRARRPPSALLRVHQRPQAPRRREQLHARRD